MACSFSYLFDCLFWYQTFESLPIYTNGFLRTVQVSRTLSHLLHIYGCFTSYIVVLSNKEKIDIAHTNSSHERQSFYIYSFFSQAKLESVHLKVGCCIRREGVALPFALTAPGLYLSTDVQRERLGIRWG